MKISIKSPRCRLQRVQEGQYVGQRIGIFHNVGCVVVILGTCPMQDGHGSRWFVVKCSRKTT